MQLNQRQAASVLRRYSFRLPWSICFRGLEEIKDKKLIFPSVLKIDSKAILHKTEHGLVFTGLKNRHDISEAYSKAEKNIRKLGILEYNYILQEMAGGIELIVGMKTDKTFGKVILFGVGGIFVELMKDVSMRIAPLKKEDAAGMIEGIKSKKMLGGFRSMPPVDLDGLVAFLINFSRMAEKEKELTEIDFNPVMAEGNNFLVVDARMIKGDRNNV